MTAEETAAFILTKEGRFDAKGNLTVYRIPEGDGGGQFEIAGINNRYHPVMAEKLRQLIQAGEHDNARAVACEYLITYTAGVAPWHDDPRVVSFLRDCAFNRGRGGAAAILQHSLSVAGTYRGALDGLVGPATKAASNRHAAEDLVLRLLLSRQAYERFGAGRSEESKFWRGLTNRWIDAVQFSLEFGDATRNLY